MLRRNSLEFQLCWVAGVRLTNRSPSLTRLALMGDPMSDRNLSATLAAIPGKRILILGDVILDEYIWGEVRRISPEAPVPVVEIRRRSYLPGGAANAAANVVSLGGVALLAGLVGPDAEAER